MKKLIRLIIACIIIVCIAAYLRSKGYLDFGEYFPNENIKNEDIVTNSLQSDNSVYYYKQLSEYQKGLYNKILYGISKFDDEVALNINTEYSQEKTTKDVSDIFSYILADHPEIWYVDSGYSINVSSIVGINIVKVGIKYTVKNKAEADLQVSKVSSKIDEIIAKNIKEGMTDYKKELAIHDYLASNIVYYKYKDINSIPDVKHTAYGSIIGKSAVCDGITKGYQLILNKLDIENILVQGTLDNVAHAWNLVKLDGNYYHTDLTSDTTLISAKANTPVHVYFNITDIDILETHEIQMRELLPISNSTEYNYYKYENKEITAADDFDSKLKSIVKGNRNTKILELKITNVYNSAQKLINGLYKLNYNKVKTNRQRNISYNKELDVYIFMNK